MSHTQVEVDIEVEEKWREESTSTKQIDTVKHHNDPKSSLAHHQQRAYFHLVVRKKQ